MLTDKQKLFFHNIDTEAKAYWLGFIYADGNIRADYRTMRINLSTKDESHLKKFADLFKLKIRHGKGGKGHKYAYCALNCTVLCKKLEEIGIMPNKSNKDSRILFSNIPDHLMNHFIRGFFDGDGFFSGSTVGFVGNKLFLKRLKDEFVKNNVVIEKSGSLIPHSSIYKLSWHGKHLKSKLENWMFENATIFMERKWNHLLLN